MLKTENFYINDSVKEFINGETKFPYIDKCLSDKDILIKILSLKYEKNEDKYEELKNILNKLTDYKNKYKFIFKNENLENIEVSKNYIFENKIDLENIKIFNIYKELSKSSLIENLNFNLILETYYILKEIAIKNFKGSLKGKIFITSGFGNTGIALSQAVKYLGGISIVIDINPFILRKREEEGFCDYVFEDFNTAFDFAFSYKKEKQSKVIALLGNGTEVINRILNEGFLPDIITDSTNTDLNKYFPSGYDYYDAIRINKVDNHHSKNISKHSIMILTKAMLELQKRGVFVFEFSNNFRQVAFDRGLENAFVINDIEDIILNKLLELEKTNFKFLSTSFDSEELFLINDLLYQDFYDNEDIKTNTEIFLNLPNKNNSSYHLKIDNNYISKFFEKVNEMIINKDISYPLLISKYNFNKNIIPDNKSYFLNINSYFNEFQINEELFFIDDENKLSSNLF